MRLHLFFIFFTGNSLCSRRRGYWLEFIGLVFRAELSEPDVWNQSKQPEGVQKWRMFRSVSWWIVWAAVLGPVTSLPIRRWTTAPWAGWTPFVWEVPPLVAVTVRFSAICKKTPSINTKTNRKYIFFKYFWSRPTILTMRPKGTTTQRQCFCDNCGDIFLYFEGKYLI